MYMLPKEKKIAELIAQAEIDYENFEMPDSDEIIRLLSAQKDKMLSTEKQDGSEPVVLNEMKGGALEDVNWSDL